MFKLTRFLAIFCIIAAILTFPVIVGAAEDASPVPEVETEMSETSESTLSLPARFLLPFVFNRSFEIPEGLKWVRDGRRPHLVAEKPRGWETFNPANSIYNFLTNAHNGRSSVSGNSVMVDDPFFGCKYEIGGWRQEGRIRINPANTYQLSYWARYHDLLSGASITPASQITVYDSQGEQITGISTSPSFSVAEGSWEQLTPLTIGPGGTFGWPENAALVKVDLFATGFNPSGCTPGKIATVDFDDVSFHP